MNLHFMCKDKKKKGLSSDEKRGNKERYMRAHCNIFLKWIIEFRIRKRFGSMH